MTFMKCRHGSVDMRRNHGKVVTGRDVSFLAITPTYHHVKKAQDSSLPLGRNLDLENTKLLPEVLKLHSGYHYTAYYSLASYPILP